MTPQYDVEEDEPVYGWAERAGEAFAVLGLVALYLVCVAALGLLAVGVVHIWAWAL